MHDDIMYSKLFWKGGCFSISPDYVFSPQGCQLEPANQVYYNIGDSTQVSFYYDGSNLVGTYLADDGQR